MNPEVTMLSFGGGQDSTAILYKLAYEEEFRARYAPGRLVVVMSDTGDEHPGTYRHVEKTRQFCEEQNIEFHFLTSDKGYHSESWLDLRHQYRRNKTVGSKAYMKTCTTNLKVDPIYRFFEEWLAREYGVKNNRKRGFYEFTKKHGKVRVLIGIAGGEEGRVAKKDAGPLWMIRNVEKVYPLVDLGMDRQACQDYIRLVGMEVPPPSNCMLCPFMSEIELLWLYLHHPDDFHDWVDIEAEKIKEYARRGKPAEKNYGVWNRKLLPEKLEEALGKHGHMTPEEIDDYKMSHGHCVTTAY